MQTSSRKITPQPSPNSGRLGVPRRRSPGTAAVRLIRRLLMVSGLLLGRGVPIPPEPPGMIRLAISRAMRPASARRCAPAALRLASDRKHRILSHRLAPMTTITAIGQKLLARPMVSPVAMVRIVLCRMTVAMPRIVPYRATVGTVKIALCRVIAGMVRIAPCKTIVATTGAMIGEAGAMTASLRATITIVTRAATTGQAMHLVLPTVHLGRICR